MHVLSCRACGRQDVDIGLLLRNVRRRVVQNLEEVRDEAKAEEVKGKKNNLKDDEGCDYCGELEQPRVFSSRLPLSMAEMFPAKIREGIEHWVLPMRRAMKEKRSQLPQKQKKKARVQLGCGGAAPEAWLHEDNAFSALRCITWLCEFVSVIALFCILIPGDRIRLSGYMLLRHQSAMPTICAWKFPAEPSRARFPEYGRAHDRFGRVLEMQSDLRCEWR